MTNEQIGKAIEFLHRTTLHGHEVPAFNEVIGALVALATPHPAPAQAELPLDPPAGNE